MDTSGRRSCGRPCCAAIPRGEDVPFVLDAPTGPAKIGGETLMSTFMDMPPEAGGGLQLQQVLVRYSRDGESGIAMTERSITPDRLA
jgi:hypothetical protein